ncbi:MAG: (Fe-S)-binding protein [Deltaproteobacteria bacterium]
MKEINPGGSRCAKCGACAVVCPLYQVSGREENTARGKLHMLSRLNPKTASAAFADTLSRCLLCGACRKICPQQVDVPARIVAARRTLARQADRHFWRKYLVRQALAHPKVLNKTLGLAAAASERMDRLLPSESGLRLRLGLIADSKELHSRHGRYVENTTAADSPAAAYFVGCLADHLEPGIAQATAALTSRATGTVPAVPSGQACCGQAAFSCGDFDLARELARQNIAAFAGQELPILTSCASCYSHLLTYPELFREDPAWHGRAVAFTGRVQEFSTFFQGKLTPVPKTKTAAAVFYHDPCHLRHGPTITDAPRQLLSAAGLLLEELPGGPRCCGQGGLFHLAHHDLSAKVRDRLLSAFQPLAAEIVTTTCSGCLLQWRQSLARTGSRIRVQHLAELLAEPLAKPRKNLCPDRTADLAD